MRGYFDDEEPERKARGRDIEVTLGAGALLGIFSGLALLCGLCFGLGYLLGHRVSATAATAAHPAARVAEGVARGLDIELSKKGKMPFEDLCLGDPTSWWLDG